MTSGRILAILVLVGAAAVGSARGPEAHAQPSAAAPPDVINRFAWLSAPGYLTAATRPNSVALIPPPPGLSATQARDDAAARAAIALRGSPRWMLATSDAQLTLDLLAQDFSCALGFTLSQQTTPATLALLKRATPDLVAAPSAAKKTYMRPRPFMSDGAPSCTPEQEGFLRGDGSYPSGHSAIGWGWGLILAELAPDRGDAILARAREFGQSRVVCNVHWQSDVEEGRIVATATVARLHADPQFRADLDAARAEVEAAERGASAPPAPRCAAEAAQLSTQ